MRLSYIAAIILLSQLILSSPKDCDDISPKSPSDCKLSSSDKNNGQIYCCYEEFLGEKVCEAYDEEGYEEEKEAAELFGAKFECTTAFSSGNEARFIKLSVISFIILSILNI